MPWNSIIDHGPTGLLALCVVLILIGWLLPRTWVRERLRDKDRELERERERNDLLTSGLRDLLTYAEAADRILQAWYRRYEVRESDSRSERKDSR